MLPIAILAGGLATRLRPLTEMIPKALIEIRGRPFVDWQLRLLSRSGVDKVVFCVAYKSEMIREFVGNGSRYGIKVTYSEDGPSQLGTGGAIRKAIPFLDHEFMTLYGDSYLPIDYQAVERAFFSAQKLALMTVYHNEGSLDASNVIFTHGDLQKYAKHDGDPKMAHIDYGLSVFNRSVFEAYPSGSYSDLSDICSRLAGEGSLAGYEVHERFYEIGSLKGIEDFSEYIERNRNVL
jgi:MurNAc alpha-1-phosphate uridylyltransferase